MNVFELCNQDFTAIRGDPGIDDSSLAEPDQKTPRQIVIKMAATATTSAPIQIPGPASNNSDITNRSDTTPPPPPVPSNTPADNSQPPRNPAKPRLITKSSTNLIDHINNRTHAGYIYQIPLPTPHPKHNLKLTEPERTAHTACRKNWREELASWRVLHDIGLREWEWSCGEPTTAFDMSRSDRSPYAERFRSFTYTRADDPLLRGRKLLRSSRRRGMVVWADGEFGDEVDFPEYMPEMDMDCEIEVRTISCEDDGGQEMWLE